MYTLVNRDEESSVYNCVKNLLLEGSSEKTKWREVHQDFERFNLMFGERKRKGLDYTRLGIYICIKPCKDQTNSFMSFYDAHG